MNDTLAREATPKAFISYSWDDDEHRDWVRQFAKRLRDDGVTVTLDTWHTAPGTQLPHFMEKAIRENDFVLIICTPRYKQRSDSRIGGAGYEGDIMTAEVLTKGNHQKFIPILRIGNWQDAAPVWLVGKYYVDLRGEPFRASQYEDLLTTLHDAREEAPPVGSIPAAIQALKRRDSRPISETKRAQGCIKIKGIIVDAVTTPRNDGTPGSALYKVPFQLSALPDDDWVQLFVDTWNHPPTFTSMHRSGIARVEGDRVILDGTTIEEVEKYHRDTLTLVLKHVNEKISRLEEDRKRRSQAQEKELLQHKDNVQDVAKRLKFD
jgi:TIR domain